MKKIFICSLAGIFLVFFSLPSFAGLINYERLRRFKEKQAAGEKDLKMADMVVPAWVDNEPEAKSEKEKHYDINKDGYLQIPEVKIFLRAVTAEAKEKGGYMVDSDILKEYDKNKDSYISKTEALEMAEDVK